MRDFMNEGDDTAVGKESSSSFVENRQNCSLLERLPFDAFDIVLSCLTLDQYGKLSVVSKRIYDAVSRSSHLHMGGNTFLFSQAPISKDNYRGTKLSQSDCVEQKCRQPLNPRDSLKKLLKRFHNLNVIHLQGLASIGDDVVSILNESPAASSINKISLHGCALSYWCTHSFRLKHLQHITLLGGSIRARIYSLLEHSPHLKSLSLSQCSALRDDNLLEIGLLVRNNLQELTLNQCTRLHHPVLSLPSLTGLSLVGCFGLSGLKGFSFPRLQRLNLSFCVRITGLQIEELIVKLPLLEELIMMKCAGVHSFRIASRNLKRLNLSFSHNLRELGLACPALGELETIACSSLCVLVLKKAKSMHKLDLSGSNCLRALEIQAPNLRQLNLQGCRRLDQCEIYCPNLEFVNMRGSRTVALRFSKDIRRVLFKSWSNHQGL